MKCKNCGKEIDDNEIFCKDCTKSLKKASSKKEVNELEDLINEQLELNKFEQTKELDNLNELIAEENIIENKEVETSNETREDRLKNVLDQDTQKETREERLKENIKQKKKNKKIVFVCIVVIIVILITVISILLLKSKSKEEVIDYEKVINEYGKSLELEVIAYVKEKDESPSWEYINSLVKTDKYKINCSTHEIYSDGIYLDNCKVNNVKVEYTYGNKKEEVKKTTTINIYKIEIEDNIYSYFGNNEPGTVLAGTITCETDTCEYINAFNSYVIIKEENAYYLYDYENDKKLFGPFNISSNYNQSLLLDKNNLYGIYYNEDGINKLYSTVSKKAFSNIKGTLQYENNYNTLYRYNYAIFNNKGVNDFINLNTGNVSYSIKGTIKQFKEDSKNKIVYMLVYEDNSNEFKVYNNNGKALFNDEKFINIIFNTDSFIVSKNINYKVYDSKLNLKTNSKNYNNILGIYESFVVVVDNNTLKIVDLDDKELAVFDIVWNSNYSLNYESSGWDDTKKQIQLSIIDKYGSSFTCYTDTKGNSSCTK